MKQDAKHPHSPTPDCCSQKSSYSILKVILWVGLAALLVAAFVQARAQDAAPPSAAPAQTPAPPAADHTADQPTPPADPGETPQPRHGRVVRLGFVQGQVQILHAGKVQFDQAVANMPLVESSVLQTGADGRAEVQFEDGSIARIVPNSQLQLDQLAGNAPGSLETSVSLLSGEGYFELRPVDGDIFAVHAAGLQLLPVQIGSFRINLAAPAQLAVSDGAVRVSHAGDYKVQVNANETLTLDEQDPTRYMLAAGTSADPNDQWNEDRDQFLNDAAARSPGVQAGSDASGRDDLDAYGNFYDVPGVGQVWQPYGYDASSWDPFDAGYWAWYPWGYTWISAYPWGWAPFHCGSWNYFDDFGWGWVGSGDCGFGYWAPVSGWTNPPRWWRRPLPPQWHRHPPVGRRIEPVGVVKDHPFTPMPGKPVPRGYKPGPVTIGGRSISPLQPHPITERFVGAAPGVHTDPNSISPEQRIGNAPSHTGAPTWHGGSGYSRPAPTLRSAPPPQHSSPPPASHSGPPPSSSGSHK